MGHMGGNGDGGTTSKRVLDLLGDAVAREILQAGVDGPVTIDDLTARTSVSQSTIYRRLSALIESGLMREEHGVTSTPSKRAYTTTTEHIGIDLAEDDFRVHLDPAMPYTNAPREIDIEPLRVDLDTRTVTIELSPDDALFEQFERLWELQQESK
ncbi:MULTISPECIES: winged helix-turn-helix domain-containing protein [unclassified Haladaptatus]|uniref:winged helix-turn-helix domain-containing protein n=1 Tax=unclassified Haladaptatus TaxID=2622732 RepID=UPI002FCDF567